jgi:hypothetical protein
MNAAAPWSESSAAVAGHNDHKRRRADRPGEEVQGEREHGHAAQLPAHA